MNRQEVHACLDSEREFQEAMKKDPNRPNILQEMQMGSVLHAIEVNLARASDVWYEEGPPYEKTAAFLRKIGALVLQAGETFGMKHRNIPKPEPKATLVYFDQVRSPMPIGIGFDRFEVHLASVPEIIMDNVFTEFESTVVNPYPMRLKVISFGKHGWIVVQIVTNDPQDSVSRDVLLKTPWKVIQ